MPSQCMPCSVLLLWKITKPVCQKKGKIKVEILSVCILTANTFSRLKIKIPIHHWMQMDHMKQTGCDLWELPSIKAVLI